MRKIIYIFLLLILNAEIINAQYIYFNKRISITDDYDVCRGILAFNYGYLVAGGHGPGNIIYISYLDSLANLKWTKDFTEVGYNYFFGLSGSLFQTTDKYIALCGSRVPYYSYSILIKVDSLGNKKWEKEYQISGYVNNAFSSGNITKDNGYILTGKIRDAGNYQYFLFKADSIGNQQWYKTYTDNDPNREYEGKCIIQTPDKGYCLGGRGGVLV